MRTLPDGQPYALSGLTGTMAAALGANPGELLVVSNPAAMDAAGTWSLLVDVVYRRID